MSKLSLLLLPLLAGLAAASCSTGAHASAGGVAKAKDGHNYHEVWYDMSLLLLLLKSIAFFTSEMHSCAEIPSTQGVRSFPTVPPHG